MCACVRACMYVCACIGGGGGSEGWKERTSLLALTLKLGVKDLMNITSHLTFT